MKLLILAGLLTITSATFAQAPAAPPVPVQIQSAKTVFLGMGSVMSTEYTTYLYTDTYSALTAAGYKLAANPTDADIVIEAGVVANSQVTGGDSAGRAYVQLVLFDIKTHTKLWTVEAPISGAIRAAAMQKNFDKAASDAVATLKTLASGALPAK